MCPPCPDPFYETACTTPLSPQGRPPSPAAPPPPTSLSMPAPAVTNRRDDALKALIAATELDLPEMSRKRRRSSSPLTEVESSEEEEAVAVGHSQERDGEDVAGMPTREDFLVEVEKYLNGLHRSKRGKALMTRSMHAELRSVLANPTDTSIRDAQFRFWARQRFHSLPGDILMHDKKIVTVKEELYETLCEVHKEAKHGGRDKTYGFVKKKYAYIPKEVTAGFIKHCPTCADKREVERPSKRRKVESPDAVDHAA